MSEASSEIVHQLIAEVGDAGIEEMRRAPGLAAAVDQHMAAVRDVIKASGDDPVAEVLLDYVHGFVDAAIERGWWPTGEFDWETTRVIAVHALLRKTGR
ncbi:DUF6401 family natural product biosynthesis protein [Actinomadura sp. DC4]|uniref:DUF6401 family natural product biosynthesis protein n=1 Tax=Actinomadura sp. DC4 TaxID=3055069 RepID=UPI0025B20C90|nr:DUF6401 family natural product biosynthesis protein [Actinomadura sp. DC4]MDN3353101.1 DUF6401 family natural product biosynthesis protein [Actinomadura sp. DC4]